MDDFGRNRWALVGAALLSIAALVIVVQGSIGSGNPVPSRLADVVAAMRTTSARFTRTEATNEADTTSPGPMTGVFDFRRQVGRLNIPAAPQSAAEEWLFVRGSSYSNDTTGVRNLPANKHWTVQTASRGRDGFVGGLLQLLTEMQSGRHARDLGAATVDSESTRHYEASVPPLPVPRALRPMTARLDLYVDVHNHVVRLVEVRTFKNNKVVQTEQFDFSSYGVPVYVVAPPPGQVAKLL